MYCIYRITNNINGHTYIGQHKYTDESNPMGKYKGSGVLLHKAYKKYGKENFTAEILYQRIRDKDTVNAMEIWSIEKYKPEYNIAKGGDGGDTLSGKSPEERAITLARMSKAVSGENNPMFGRSIRDFMAPEKYEEWKKHVSEGAKKVLHTEEWNTKVKTSLRAFYDAGNHGSNYGKKLNHHGSNYGKKFTQEHSNKISESRKGYKWYNNGFVSVQAKECPGGFVPGLCEADKAKRRGHEPWNKGKKGVQTAWNKGMRKNVEDKEDITHDD